MLIRNQYDGQLYEVPDGPVGGYGEYSSDGYQGLGLPIFGALAAKAAARFLPKALPYARRFLRGVFPGRSAPLVGAPPPFHTGNLATRVAQRVVALLRQEGLQPAPGAPAPAPTVEPAPPAPPVAEPQPGLSEYPYFPARQYLAQQYPPRPYPGVLAAAAVPIPADTLLAAPYSPAPFPGATPQGWVQPSMQYPGTGGRRLYLRCSTWRGQPGLVPGPGMAVQPGALPGPGSFATPLAPPVASPYAALPRRYRRRRYRRPGRRS